MAEKKTSRQKRKDLIIKMAKLLMQTNEYLENAPEIKNKLVQKLDVRIQQSRSFLADLTVGLREDIKDGIRVAKEESAKKPELKKKTKKRVVKVKTKTSKKTAK